MLFPTPEIERQRRGILQDLHAGKISRSIAAERLWELVEDPVACLMRGEECRDAGDLDGAESWQWKGLDLQPAQFTFYLALAATRRSRDPNDALAARLYEMALWKLGDSHEIPEAIAEESQALAGDDTLDFSDPETYRMVAMLKQIEREKQYAEEDHKDRPEVVERLLPYLLLTDLQLQASGAVEYGVVQEIRENAGRCAPLLWAGLREWWRHPERVQPKAAAMFAAILGEIGGSELLPDLLELAIISDPEILLHANWAIWRLGQRFPDEALAVLEERAKDARLTLRCAIADQLALLPKELNIRQASEALLADFRTLARKPDAPYLLLSVSSALGLRNEQWAESLVERYAEMLPRKAMKWILDTVESEGGFVPRLIEEGIDQLNIEDVCLERSLMTDEDDAEDQEDGDEGGGTGEERGVSDKPAAAVTAHRKPGRNDPCWCGSGKKYKKCHLEVDEANERSGGPAPVSASGPSPAPREGGSESDNQAHQRLSNMILAAVQEWNGEGEMKRAFQRFFDAAVETESPNEEALDLFLQWYVHDCRIKSTGRTGFEEYLRREGGRLNPRDRAMVESMRDACYGLYEVQHVEEGRGIDVRNVFRGDRFFIHDVSSSKEAVKWDCLLGRVEYFEGRYTFSGNGQVVPRNFLGRLQEFAEAEARKTQQTPAGFVESHAHRMRRKLLEMQRDFREGIQITNALGEPLEFSSATYSIKGDISTVLAGLRKIGNLRETTSAKDPEGHHEFDWVQSVDGEAPVRSFGSIRVAGGRLRLSCMSRRRLEVGREMLERELGPLLRHREDRFESLGEAAANAREESKAPPKPLDPQFGREIILNMKNEHYAKWPDTALPALGGKTPREMVRTEEGRGKVLDLIRGIENLEERERKEGRPAMEVTELRQNLGLAED